MGILNLSRIEVKLRIAVEEVEAHGVSAVLQRQVEGVVAVEVARLYLNPNPKLLSLLIFQNRPFQSI